MSENSTIPQPDKPSEDVISDYYEGVKDLEMQGHETGIKKARNALFITAALLLVSELIQASSTNFEFTPLLIVFIVIEVGIFVGLALWTKSKPYTAIIIGLILFILLWILTIALTDISAAFRGILVRIIIIASLASAIKPAKAWEDLKKTK